jgi:hypothetical protein
MDQDLLRIEMEKEIYDWIEILLKDKEWTNLHPKLSILLEKMMKDGRLKKFEQTKSVV